MSNGKYLLIFRTFFWSPHVCVRRTAATAGLGECAGQGMGGVYFHGDVGVPISLLQWEGGGGHIVCTSVTVRVIGYSIKR
jgi:hypothetical protein